jgi:hypothetical protein
MYWLRTVTRIPLVSADDIKSLVDNVPKARDAFKGRRE